MKFRLFSVLTSFIFLFGNAAAQGGEPDFRYKLGDAEVILIVEEDKDNTADILIDAPEAVVSRYAPGNKFPASTNAFIIKSPDRTLLVDAGYGRNVVPALERNGISPDAVDGILLTHLHGDHIGGLVADGRAVFPNALLYISWPEYQYWIQNKDEYANTESFDRAKNVVEKYGDRIFLFFPGSLDGNTNELFPGVTAAAAYGHTPGHTAYIVESKGNRMIFWGDVIHAQAVQMPHPEIAVTYDVDPRAAAATRSEILEYVQKNNLLVAGMHQPYPAIGKVRKADAGYRFEPAN